MSLQIRRSGSVAQLMNRTIINPSRRAPVNASFARQDTGKCYRPGMPAIRSGGSHAAGNRRYIAPRSAMQNAVQSDPHCVYAHHNLQLKVIAGFFQSI
jgi:hypothetical protein